MKNSKIIIDASSWKCFGFDALSSKEFYQELAKNADVQASFHNKYDKVIKSSATMKRMENAEDYINNQFEDFFGKLDIYDVTWNNRIIKAITDCISIHYINRCLKPFFLKIADSIKNVKLTGLDIERTGIGYLELTFTVDADEGITEEELVSTIEESVVDFNSPVTEGVAVNPEDFTKVCGLIQDIIINEAHMKLSPSFNKFVMGFLKS